MVTQTELNELNETAERTALSVVISWALAARRDAPPSGLFLADDLDWASAQISFMMAEAEKQRAALEDIANPLQGIERRAKAEGCVVNYPMAQALAEQGSYLRGLARDALSASEQSAHQITDVGEKSFSRVIVGLEQKVDRTYSDREGNIRRAGDGGIDDPEQNAKEIKP